MVIVLPAASWYEAGQGRYDVVIVGFRGTTGLVTASGMRGDMSIPTGVDSDAPVRAHHETDIDAPLDTVWQLHTDVNGSLISWLAHLKAAAESTT